MTDPSELLDSIEAAEDAFTHAHGEPNFEPELNASPGASAGEVQIQKACRLLTLIQDIETLGPYYGAILEFSFRVIENTLQGYLIIICGVEPRELRDHDTPYDRARGQVPLNDRR